MGGNLVDSVIDYGIIDPEAPAPIIQAMLERCGDSVIGAELDRITDEVKRRRVREHLITVRRMMASRR